MVQDLKAKTWRGVEGCKIEAQWKGGVKASSMLSLFVAAGESCDSLGVRFENMRPSWVGPAGTERGGVSMAGGGKAKAQGRSMVWGAIAGHPCHVFFLESTCVFRLSVSIRKVASEYPFCVLIYMNSYIFHIHLILFIFLSNTYLRFCLYKLDVIIGRHTWMLLLSPYG